MPAQRIPEKRTYTYRARLDDAAQNGVLVGYASQVGVLDAYSSVILPGAFDRCLPGFLKSGHVCFNHDWSAWIGMPLEARMEGAKLKVSAEFYGDEYSQSVRQKIKERQDRNLETDFSITFWPDWDKTEFFESGEKLMTYARGLGVDMSLMDPKIAGHDSYCWLIGEVTELGEWGPVMSGATPGAGATSVRSLNDLRDGSLAGLSLENHLDHALAAVQGVLARFADYQQKRELEGRQVSRDRLAQVAALKTSMAELELSCRADDPAWRKLQMEADAVLAGI